MWKITGFNCFFFFCFVCVILIFYSVELVVWCVCVCVLMAKVRFPTTHKFVQTAPSSRISHLFIQLAVVLAGASMTAAGNGNKIFLIVELYSNICASSMRMYTHILYEFKCGRSTITGQKKILCLFFENMRV